MADGGAERPSRVDAGRSSWHARHEHRLAGLLRVDWVSLDNEVDVPKTYEGEHFFHNAGFAAAFLAAKRSSVITSESSGATETAALHFHIPVVYDCRRPVAFGRPCEWANGVASRVLSRELRLATVHFRCDFGPEDAGTLSVKMPLFAIDNAGAAFLDWRVHTAQGARSCQEDRYTCEPEMDKNEQDYPGLCKIGLPALSFFGVYDGHGGADTAEMLHDQLHREFAQHLSKQAVRLKRATGGLSLQVAMQAAFKAVDEHICETYIARQQQKAALMTWYKSSPGRLEGFERLGSARAESSGAAAVTGVLCGRELVVAHVGDCRAVLARADGTVHVLTQDHNFRNIKEKERVVLAGGQWDQDRLNSFLDISRAFGDVDLSPSDASQCRKHDGLSAEPDIMQITVDEKKHEMLLLASDGMWCEDNAANFGFRSALEVIEHLRKQLRRNDNDLAAALQSAIAKAINGNDGDNCTAVLIAFRRFEQEPEYAGITFPKTRPRFFNSKKAAAVEDSGGGHGVHGAGGTAVVDDGDEARAIRAQALPS